MKHERISAEQSQWSPMRTMPLFRKARRPRRMVFRVPMDLDTFTASYEDEWTDTMDSGSRELGDSSCRSSL